MACFEVHSEFILFLSRPAVTNELAEATRGRNPKNCVIADCGGAFELVRDGIGLQQSGPADPAAAVGGGIVEGGIGAAEEGSVATAAVRVWSDDEKP